jgi:branched-chain amino acid transport system ATP-binding protein
LEVIEPLLETHQLVKSYGAMMVTASVSVSVRSGEIHALIGPNGAGKTTLIAQIAGELAPDSGTITFDGRDITSLPVYERARLGIRRMFQLTSVFLGYTAVDNLLLAFQAQNGHHFSFWKDGRKDRVLRQSAMTLLDRVGMGGRAETKAGALSHGEQRQLELAMVLAGSPRLLLLDEPTAGMGLDETERMVKLLSTLRGKYSVLLVEHDMDAVYALADRVTVLVYGRVIASGTVDEIRSHAEVRLAYLGDDEMGDPHASSP